jgi:hypothetical protein
VRDPDAIDPNDPDNPVQDIDEVEGDEDSSRGY